jgi:hypothetical protein
LLLLLVFVYLYTVSLGAPQIFPLVFSRFSLESSLLELDEDSLLRLTNFWTSVLLISFYIQMFASRKTGALFTFTMFQLSVVESDECTISAGSLLSHRLSEIIDRRHGYY